MSGQRFGLRHEWFELYPVESRLLAESSQGSDAVFLVDVAGGKGHVISSLSSRCPGLPGRLIIQDLPLTFEDHTPLKNIEAMPYDMFTKQPIEGWSHFAWNLSCADVESAPVNCHAGTCAYFFRSVLHEESESRSRDILAHTAGAMRAGYSKLLIEDLVLPDRGADMRQVSVDMSMYFLPEGIERTAGQWKVLLEHAGLQIVKIWSDGSAIESITEAELWVNKSETESSRLSGVVGEHETS